MITDIIYSEVLAFISNKTHHRMNIVTKEIYEEILVCILKNTNHNFTKFDLGKFNESFIYSNMICCKCNLEFILDIELDLNRNSLILYKDNVYYDFRKRTDLDFTVNNISCNECIIKSIIE